MVIRTRFIFVVFPGISLPSSIPSSTRLSSVVNSCSRVCCIVYSRVPSWYVNNCGVVEGVRKFIQFYRSIQPFALSFKYVVVRFLLVRIHGLSIEIQDYVVYYFFEHFRSKCKHQFFQQKFIQFCVLVIFLF